MKQEISKMVSEDIEAKLKKKVRRNDDAEPNLLRSSNKSSAVAVAWARHVVQTPVEKYTSAKGKLKTTPWNVSTVILKTTYQ